MTKSNELRLGNWVEYNDYPSKGFTRLNEHLMTCVFSDENWINHFISPIPLTEEILLKCGFEKVREYFQIDWFVIYKDKKGYYAHINCGNNYINNLHQLQNLYFALTNEELTITL